MTEKNSAHRYFWLIMILVAVLVFGMIYFLSVTQAKEEKETQKLENKLNEQISTTKGIEEGVLKLTAENENLKAELNSAKSEALALYKEKDVLKQINEFQAAFINGDVEKCRMLAGKINPQDLDGDNLSAYSKICEELEITQKTEEIE